jgi:hypothetical protein
LAYSPEDIVISLDCLYLQGNSILNALEEGHLVDNEKREIEKDVLQFELSDLIADLRIVNRIVHDTLATQKGQVHWNRGWIPMCTGMRASLVKSCSYLCDIAERMQAQLIVIKNNIAEERARVKEGLNQTLGKSLPCVIISMIQEYI